MQIQETQGANIGYLALRCKTQAGPRSLNATPVPPSPPAALSALEGVVILSPIIFSGVIMSLKCGADLKTAGKL